jgi:outer membrane protein assembly factor BamB
MTASETIPRKPLRLWPGVAAAILVLIGFALPSVSAQYAVYGMIGFALGTLIILLWWLLISRARWYERLGAIVLIVLAAIAEKYVVDPSVAGGGMGNMAYLLVTPTLCVALVAWASVSRRLAPGPRAAAAAAAVVLGCLPWTLLRTGGITAEGKSDFHWRWSATPEERLLAKSANESLPPPAAVPSAAAAAPAPAASEPSPPAASPAPGAKTAAAAKPEAAAPIVSAVPMKRAEWPGFRGPDRNGVVHGVHIATDWSQSPPVQMWRHDVGPGWSSFAVSGNFFYTQEQRGGDEVVSCYRVSNGEPVWRHRDATRFWESNGGAGPRGTPTLHDGRVYTFGGTGLLNVLDAATGALVWSHNAASDTHVKTPMWGFSSSPLVVGNVVIVATGGKLAAYDIASGALRWMGGGGGFSYSSPHLASIDGVDQVIFMSGPGTVGVEPATGKVLWRYAWDGGAIVQPGLTAEGDVLVNTISMSGGLGIRRISIAHQSGAWTSSERWSSTGLKPYFNDFVVHKGYAYGFDGAILSCIDLQDGTRKWKGGRYGNGQLVLLADQDLLLVLSEEGELALVKAAPDQFTEIAARIPALEGKTWNHPVLVRDVLLVRNDHEMAAFRLTRSDQSLAR